jgi:hypothetical protein
MLCSSRIRSFGESISGRLYSGGGAAASLASAGQHLLDLLELVSLELPAGRLPFGEPAVHQRQQVAAELALVRVAQEHLLRIVRVDRDLLAADMVAGAAERAVDAHFGLSPFAQLFASSTEYCTGIDDAR